MYTLIFRDEDKDEIFFSKLSGALKIMKMHEEACKIIKDIDPEDEDIDSSDDPVDVIEKGVFLGVEEDLFIYYVFEADGFSADGFQPDEYGGCTFSTEEDFDIYCKHVAELEQAIPGGR